MSATVHCSRCGQEGPALSRNPLPGPAGAEVRARVCAPCWEAWAQMEVMVINELRLNFMDPKAPQILEEHMRQFLGLASPGQPAA
ncbi:MAG TPA: Fe(2+)-trafficking protein [Thermoanaerobaculia bacterium]|nr:Fe(2+)-trafficking protein [Thermoanaerobaculia bacterium]